MQPHQINQLAEKIESLLPPGLKQVKQDFDEKLKKLLQQQLSDMDFVSREDISQERRMPGARAVQGVGADAAILQHRVEQASSLRDFQKCPGRPVTLRPPALRATRPTGRKPSARSRFRIVSRERSRT